MQFIVPALADITPDVKSAIVAAKNSRGYTEDIEIIESDWSRTGQVSFGVDGWGFQYPHIAQAIANGDLEEAMNKAINGVTDKDAIWFDTEVYPNLFVICWKRTGSDQPVHTMVNPSRAEVTRFMSAPLIGFNNRKYDNHILYAAANGETGVELFRRSTQLVRGSINATFPAAYGLGYTDILDYSTKKQSLKKYEIELGLNHMEMDIPWDKPVKDEDIPRVVEYCSNDVKVLEAVHAARHEDWAARKILCAIAGLPPIASTNNLTTRIVFGTATHSPFVYTDLRDEFPGYEWEIKEEQHKRGGKLKTEKKVYSTYLGCDVSEGGYVYAQPGIYENVGLLDVTSLHPTSMINLNVFGEYTPRFAEIVRARVAVKHLANDGLSKEQRQAAYDQAASLLDGALKPFLSWDSAEMNALAYALKIAINSVYGMTSMTTPNMCNGGTANRESNPDNIVAKRGALFMIALQRFCESKGWTVVHIKTDSIKLAGITPEMVEAVDEFGRAYGYEFEHEATYDRMCLLDKAQYAAHDHKGWHFTGAKFLHPYIKKTMFTGEEPTLDDMAETKSVQGSAAMVLGDRHVGKVGRFIPTTGGHSLMRVDGDKRGAVTGTSGYNWSLVENVKSLDEINHTYYNKLVTSMRRAIGKHGDVDAFLKGTTS